MIFRILVFFAPRHLAGCFLSCFLLQFIVKFPWKGSDALKELLSRLLAANGEAVLCTILNRAGSCPRGAGTHIAVFPDGSICGTVGGGEVERLSILEARQLLLGEGSFLRHFSISPDGYFSQDMPCAGRVSIFFERLSRAALPFLCAMQEALRGYENVWLYAAFEGETRISLRLADAAEAAAQPSVFLPQAQFFPGTPSVYTEPLVRAGRVYLFGGGHVGRALVPVLAGLDFRVTVYDSRPELANAAHFPDADAIILGDYADIFSSLTLTPEDYAILMTPEQDSDFRLLAQILTQKLSYVGCIGSRHKIAKTRERLLAAGFSEAQIDAVHSPIGLPIGAQTPKELAISIAAELIAHRALHR